MEFSAMKKLLLPFVVTVAIAGIAFVIFRPGPSPTAEERKQMDILTGQLFEYGGVTNGITRLLPVFDGTTNQIRRARTVAAFDGQHEAVRYLRVAADFLEKHDWPKDRPVRIVDFGDCVSVRCPLPPEIENQPIRWGGDYLYAVLIDKKSLTILRIGQGG